jgi:DNA-binding NarL/FixJ family response regulator
MVAESFPEVSWHLAHDVESAVALLAECEIDGLIVDLHLPGRDLGWQIAERAGRRPTLVLTADDDPRAVTRAPLIGATVAYKPRWKDAVAAHCARVGETLGVQVARFADDHALTRREREVLGLRAEDYDRDEIAEELGISPLTVRNHLRAVLAKCGMTRVSEILRHLRRARVSGGVGAPERSWSDRRRAAETPRAEIRGSGRGRG